MSDLPDETNIALQKRRAIQELMRDASILPVERNKRMQQIMMGNFNLNNNENTNVVVAQQPNVGQDTVPPTPGGGGDNSNGGVSSAVGSSSATSATAAAPRREMPRQGSSAKELIAKFENVQHNHGRMQQGPPPPPKSKDDDGTSRPGAYKSSTTAQQDGATSTTTTMDAYEQRIQAKKFGTGGTVRSGAVASTSSSSSTTNTTSMDEFEQRIQAKAKSNSGISSGGTNNSITSSSSSAVAAVRAESTSRPGASSITSNSAFEERLRRKSSQESLDSLNNNRSATSSRPGAVSESAAASQQFEQRILKKSSTSISNKNDGTMATTRSSQLQRGDGQDSSTKEFEQRILAKSIRGNLKRTNSEDSNASERSNRSVNSYSERLEQRIMEKTRSTATTKMSGGGSGSNNSNNQNDSMSSFEQRIHEKTQRGGGNNYPSSSLSRSNNNRSESETSTAGSVGSEGEGSFEKRLRNKLSASSSKLTLGDDAREARLLSSSGGGGGNKSDGGDVADSAAAAAAAAQSRKRQAIKSIMQDTSLSPQERNARLQSAMRGDWTTTEEERQMSDFSRQDSGTNEEDEGARFRRVALEAKIASKLKNKARAIQFNDDDDDDSSKDSDEDEELHRPTNHAYDDNNETSRLFADESQAVGQNSPPAHGSDGGVGFGSLPLPEEHFISDRDRGEDPFPDHHSPRHHHEGEEDNIYPAQITDPTDENFGLAVASAVAPDDEPAYVYNAIEFDPDAKPPLHLNRRFRAYTYVALGMIGIVVVLVVVYVTGLSKQTEINEELTFYEESPTSSPTKSPITDREESGIIEQIEGGVLVRNETFDEMKRGDPRLMALDWILHTDMMQLVSDDINLYQRFALAVLAYSLDSPAWYKCGDPGENYTESECLITYPDNSTAIFGTWLSSTSECGWFGVTCSADGVVRGVDLNNNDLIGIIPAEIYAISFLQLLHLPNNCLFGTIPPEIGKLRHLMSLELHGNGLSGAMPDTVYDLEKLQLLNLADQWGGSRKCNRTDGVIIHINYKMGGLASPLQDNAGLTGTLGSKIGIWRSMKGLYLNKNSFDGVIPDEIGSLRYLRFLWLSDNFIEGIIPASITKLRNLQHLRLGENFLVSSFPSELGRLSDLEILEVNGNSMFGEIPQGLYKMLGLEVLRLDDTLMNESPWLVVPDEGISGSISTFIGGLQDLRWLLLSNNPMTGTIPTELGLCEKLEVVRVHRTDFSGTMPLEVCKLRDLSLNSATGATGVLYADCRPNDRTGDPFLKCECCDNCCDHTTGVCIADD